MSSTNSSKQFVPTVAIVGRPNVGKSTLFNRLVGRKVALVYDQPGVTRDAKSFPVTLGALDFILTDTPGLFDPSSSYNDPHHPDLLSEGMRQQALQVLRSSTVILFVIDARFGVTPYDEEIAHLLRKEGIPVIIVANKCEGIRGDQGISEAYRLGFKHIVSVSAEHGLGIHDLESALEYYIAPGEIDDEQNDLKTSATESQRPLKLAIVGRPNVGKSTLVNALLEDEKQLTADYPGVTRDAITFDWVYDNRPIQLIDTAGIRRRSKVNEAVEKLAVFDTQRTIQYAEVVVLVIDASTSLQERIEKQDLVLASRLIEEGRAVIFALNKWDLVRDEKSTLKQIQETLEIHLGQARGIPCVPISALKKNQLKSLMTAIFDIYDLWNRRIPTAKLNDWLKFTLEAHPTPIVSGHRIRLKYMTQIKTRPPTFRIFCTKGADLPDSYIRYLIHSLRRDFEMPGVPIRFQFQTQKNPYDPK